MRSSSLRPMRQVLPAIFAWPSGAGGLPAASVSRSSAALACSNALSRNRPGSRLRPGHRVGLDGGQRDAADGPAGGIDDGRAVDACGQQDRQHIAQWRRCGDARGIGRRGFGTGNRARTDQGEALQGPVGADEVGDEGVGGVGRAAGRACRIGPAGRRA